MAWMQNLVRSLSTSRKGFGAYRGRVSNSTSIILFLLIALAALPYGNAFAADCPPENTACPADPTQKLIGYRDSTGYVSTTPPDQLAQAYCERQDELLTNYHLISVELLEIYLDQWRYRCTLAHDDTTRYPYHRANYNVSYNAAWSTTYECADLDFPAGPDASNLCHRVESCGPHSEDLEHTDTDVPTDGISPPLTRTYHSASAQQGFGSHWRTPWHKWVRGNPVNPATGVTVQTNDGSRHTFSYIGGSWQGAPGARGVLESVTVAGVHHGWTYKADNLVERYDMFGRLTSVADLTNTHMLAYDNSGRLRQVASQAGGVLLFEYDADDRISSVSDHADRRWDYRYDAAGNLEYVDNPDGSTKRYHYEDPRFPHALTGVTDERGIRYATYGYDEQGRVALSTHAGNAQRIDRSHHADGTRTVTNSRGHSTVYTSSAQHGVTLTTEITGPGCSTCGTGNTSYNYDLANNNLLSKTENGVTTQYGDYDTKGQYGYKIEAVGTPEQRRTDYTYDARFYNKITSITEPSVAPGQFKTTTYTYDDWGNRTSETVNGFRSDGTPVSRTTTSAYAGPLHQRSQTDGPRTDVADITTYEYYPDDSGQGANRARLLRVTDASGTPVRDAIQYTATGKVLSESRPSGVTLSYSYYYGNDRLETLTESANGVSRVTRWTYLPTGEVASITQGHGTPDATTLSFGYDDARRLTRITDGLGNYIEYVLDTEGNREQETIRDSGGALRKQLTRTFDLYNRVATTAQANETATPNHAPDGTLDTLTDGRGSVTDYSYDALRRLTQSVQAHNGADPATANATTGYGYDPADRLTSVTDPVGGTTTYAYDDLGNLLAQTSPDTGTTTFTHDAAGNVLTKTDAKGQVFGYVYDALNRLTLVDGPATLDVGYAYDDCAQGRGRLCTVMGPVATVAYRYTAFGEVAGIEQTAHTWSGSQTAVVSLDYSYDAAGRISTLIYPSGALVRYHYDAAGQVHRVELEQPQSGPVTLMQVNQRHPFGPILHGQFGNGTYLYEWRDTAYRPNWRYSGPYQQWINPYNAYDGNGNLRMFTGTEQPVFDYDALDRLANATAPSFGSRAYDYDRNGNRTALVADGATTGYGYAPQSNRLSSLGGQSVTLDANGNTTALRDLTLSYNAHNRLIAVAGRGEYRYNGLGQRVIKTRLVPGAAGQGRRMTFAYGLDGELLVETGPTGQVTREYVYLDGQPLAVLDRRPSSNEAFLRADFDGDGVITGEDFYEWYFLHFNPTPDPAFEVTGDGVNDMNDFIYLVGCAFGGQMCRAAQHESRLHYVHNDHLGTPKALTDETGTAVWRATHDPFGLATVDGDSDGDGVAVEFNVRFPGQYYDSETGLHQNGFRTYDPGTGRYLEADPIGQLGGINLYTYSLNNPIRFTDPEGLNPAAGALAGGAVAGPPGALIGGAIGLGIGILIGDAMFNDDGSDSTDAPDDDGAEQCDDDNDDNCEALYQSTLRTCASLKGMKQFRCYEAARINRDQCYQERKR